MAAVMSHQGDKIRLPSIASLAPPLTVHPPLQREGVSSVSGHNQSSESSSASPLQKPVAGQAGDRLTTLKAAADLFSQEAPLPSHTSPLQHMTTPLVPVQQQPQHQQHQQPQHTYIPGYTTGAAPSVSSPQLGPPPALPQAQPLTQRSSFSIAPVQYTTQPPMGPSLYYNGYTTVPSGSPIDHAAHHELLQQQRRQQSRVLRMKGPQACQRCGITETPEWRKGPNGARTLCNACGLFHAKILKRDGPEAAAYAILNTTSRKRQPFKKSNRMPPQLPVTQQQQRQQQHQHQQQQQQRQLQQQQQQHQQHSQPQQAQQQQMMMNYPVQMHAPSQQQFQHPFQPQQNQSQPQPQQPTSQQQQPQQPYPHHLPQHPFPPQPQPQPQQNYYLAPIQGNMPPAGMDRQ